MMWIALVDTTHHTAQAGPERVVAGLTLLERAVRLAAVKDCSHAVVAAHAERLETVEALVSDIDFGIEVTVCAVEADSTAALLTEVSDTIEPLLENASGLLYLRSSTVYDRGLVHALPSSSRDMVSDTMLEDASPPLSTPLTVSGTVSDLIRCERDTWPDLVEICDSNTSLGLEELIEEASVRLVETDAWQVRVVDEASAQQATETLWDSCRKDVDGVVSRHLNRHISLAISRAIAHTSISPNHISIVTFSLGALAAGFAAVGGYWWFLLAGLAYQINSVVDGVDGELARVKYEFSLLGEWLDTVSDDTKDVLMYAGLAFGAWRTVDSPIADLGANTWLWLGAIAVAGKLVSMLAYYTWLIANKRGDLLAFEWSFEEDTGEPSRLSELLSNLKYLTKNDFIVFLAMCMAIFGALPYFLFIVAPGQFIVATSVVVQRIQRPSEHRVRD